MRHGKTARWLLVFGATCSLASLGSAQVTELDEVDRRQTMQIGLLVERVELDAAVAGRLLMEHPDLGDSGKLRAAAQRAIADGHGEIAESCYLLTRSGNRAKLESILEFHYPSKWLPARLPEKITGPVAAGTAPGVPATPSHFVNRPLGSTAELDMVVQAGGRTAKHELATETIRLAGEESFGRGLSKVTTPLLEVQKWSTEMRSRIGTTTLVAAQHIDREPTAGGRTALVFATTKHQIPEATPEERARIEKLFEEHGPHEAAALLKNPFATPSGNDPFDTSAPAQGYPPDQPKWIMLMTGLEAIESASPSYSARSGNTPTPPPCATRSKLISIVEQPR